MKYLELLAGDLTKCPACLTPFRAVDSSSSSSSRHQQLQETCFQRRLPTKGRTCNHRICQRCIDRTHQHFQDQQSQLMASMSPSIRRRFPPTPMVFVPCPKCFSPFSFHGTNPTIDQDLVAAISDFHNTSFGGCSMKKVGYYQNHSKKNIYFILKQNCLQQPWDFPVSLYPYVFAKIVTRWSSKSLTADTIYGLLRNAIIPVHDFEKPTKTLLQCLELVQEGDFVAVARKRRRHSIVSEEGDNPDATPDCSFVVWRQL